MHPSKELNCLFAKKTANVCHWREWLVKVLVDVEKVTRDVFRCCFARVTVGT